MIIALLLCVFVLVLTCFGWHLVAGEKSDSLPRFWGRLKNFRTIGSVIRLRAGINVERSVIGAWIRFQFCVNLIGPSRTQMSKRNQRPWSHSFFERWIWVFCLTLVGPAWWWGTKCVVKTTRVMWLLFYFVLNLHASMRTACVSFNLHAKCTTGTGY